ncbi:MAG: imidazolonepropionase, partial [Fidelibacterota bacterium]
MLLKNIGQLATYDSSGQAVVIRSNVDLTLADGMITAMGRNLNSEEETIDCTGRLVTPGFVDPHTHPVFLNGREEEYLQRLAGISYEEIAHQGGGICSSIEGVRNASEKELTERVKKRMDRFLRLGTTTVEAKSGYGLNLKAELKSLRVLKTVNQSHPIDIIPTFLGAHAVPPEFEGNP